MGCCRAEITRVLLKHVLIAMASRREKVLVDLLEEAAKVEAIGRPKAYKDPAITSLSGVCCAQTKRFMDGALLHQAHDVRRISSEADRCIQTVGIPKCTNFQLSICILAGPACGYRL